MNILALDIATHTGWCTKTSHGTWKLSALRDESKGMKLIRFKKHLKEICALEEIHMIIFEMSSGQHRGALGVQNELIGIMKLFCEENGIMYASFPSSTIKKHATGKGNANKEMMIKAAQEKLGYDGNDDDEADAMWIYDLSKSHYGA